MTTEFVFQKLSDLDAITTLDFANSIIEVVENGTNKKLALSLLKSGIELPAASVTKLNGITTGATKNDTDANLKNRANHTGSQAISTITGLSNALAAKADVTDLDTKADVSALAAKADVSALAAKADVSALAAKADVSALAAKADVTDLDTKADVSALAAKADVTDLDTKADVSALAAKANLASPAFTGTPTAPNLKLNNNSRSADPSTFDYYQEGTFTPTLIGDSGTVTYSKQVGTHTIIGDTVVISGVIGVSDIGDVVGALKIGGLPQTSKNVANMKWAGSVGFVTNATGNISIVLSANSNTAELNVIDSGIAAAATEANIAPDFEIAFSITYKV